MSLLIRNGEIVTAGERYHADILCEDETITRIDRHLTAPPGAEVIDASDKYVFPGFIDPHVHIYLPFMGTFAKDTHETASRAALVGGTTTFIEMICPGSDEKPLDAFELWLGKAKEGCACDFSFHMGVTRFDPEAEQDFREIVRRGVASFKVFLAYKGALGVTDEQLYKTLALAKSLGVITTAHCENADLVLELQKKLLAAGKTGPEWHYWSRPPLVEAEGVHHLLTFAELTGAHVYIVHLSCEEALREAIRGAARGIPVWVETLIQYLLLDRTEAEKSNFEGAKAVMSPPLRDKKNQPVLWNGLRQGFISTLATDHAPFDLQPASNPGGGEDYAWRVREGLIQNPAYPNDPVPPDAVDPIFDYPHTTGLVVIGGYVYRGTRIASLRGYYVFADYLGPSGAGRIWVFRYNGSRVSGFRDITNDLFPTAVGGFPLNNPDALGEDANGELYICDIGNGNIYRIVPGR